MNNIINILTFAFQVLLTFLSTFCLYMLYAAFDYKGGFANFVGLTIFQPLWALFFSTITTIFCFVVGLPLRLNRKIKHWWSDHFYLAILLIIVGVGFCITSLTPHFIEQTTYTMEGVDRTDYVPNQMLSISGWFMTAFGTLHIYLPARQISVLESWLSNITNR